MSERASEIEREGERREEKRRERQTLKCLRRCCRHTRLVSTQSRLRVSSYAIYKSCLKWQSSFWMIWCRKKKERKEEEEKKKLKPRSPGETVFQQLLVSKCRFHTGFTGWSPNPKVFIILIPTLIWLFFFIIGLGFGRFNVKWMEQGGGNSATGEAKFLPAALENKTMSK